LTDAVRRGFDQALIGPGEPRLLSALPEGCAAQASAARLGGYPDRETPDPQDATVRMPRRHPRNLTLSKQESTASNGEPDWAR
jgi:hypothetical protein